MGGRASLTCHLDSFRGERKSLGSLALCMLTVFFFFLVVVEEFYTSFPVRPRHPVCCPTYIPTLGEAGYRNSEWGHQQRCFPPKQGLGPLLLLQFTMTGLTLALWPICCSLIPQPPSQPRECWIHNSIKRRVSHPRACPKPPVRVSVRNHVPFQEQAWGQSRSCPVVRGTLCR